MQYIVTNAVNKCTASLIGGCLSISKTVLTVNASVDVMVAGEATSVVGVKEATTSSSDIAVSAQVLDAILSMLTHGQGCVVRVTASVDGGVTTYTIWAEGPVNIPSMTVTGPA